MSYRQIFGGVTKGLKNLLLLFRDIVAKTFVECLFSTLWRPAWFLLLTPLTSPKISNFSSNYCFAVRQGASRRPEIALVLQTMRCKILSILLLILIMSKNCWIMLVPFVVMEELLLVKYRPRQNNNSCLKTLHLAPMRNNG